MTLDALKSSLVTDFDTW